MAKKKEENLGQNCNFTRGLFEETFDKVLTRINKLSNSRDLRFNHMLTTKSNTDESEDEHYDEACRELLDIGVGILEDIKKIKIPVADDYDLISEAHWNKITNENIRLEEDLKAKEHLILQLKEDYAILVETSEKRFQDIRKELLKLRPDLRNKEIKVKLEKKKKIE